MSAQNMLPATGDVMKITICTKKDIAGNLALNKLVHSLIKDHTVHVVLSDYVLPQERATEFASHLVNHERDMILEKIFPYFDIKEFHKEQIECRTFDGIADHYNVPVELWGPIGSNDSVRRMEQIAPDLIISCRYDYIFTQDVINIPKFGIYGLHPGALPEMQGLCSPFRAMDLLHTQSGCTLFKVDAGLDTGEIIDIGWSHITYNRSLLWNFIHTYFAGIDTLLRHLTPLERDKTLSSTPQTPENQMYYSYPTEAEFHHFIQNGGQLILHDDYLELLSGYIPDAQKETHLNHLRKIINLEKC